MSDPDPEKSKLMMECIDAMKKFTAPTITALYDVIDSKTGTLAGSGTFITLRDRPYILTAGHVVFEALSHKGLAHSTKYGGLPRFIDDPMKLCGPPFDLGIVRLGATAFADSQHTAASSHYLAHDSAGVDSDLLFIHGYPGKKSYPSVLLNGVFAESYPYGAGTSVSQYSWFDPDIHIALEFSPKGMIDEHGNEAGFIDPHGLSGSALWKTNRGGKSAAEWSPEQARIVGVVFAWDQKANSLIATRIEVVRRFLLDFLRDEFAYLRWEERGCPTNDDWSDWFASVDALEAL